MNSKMIVTVDGETMMNADIKTQVLNEIIKNGNEQESMLAKLFLQLENKEIGAEEFVNKTKSVTTKEMIDFSELWQKTLNSVIISQTEVLRERVEKLEHHRHNNNLY